MKSKYFHAIIFVILISNFAHGQIQSPSAGGSLHLGNISGNSPSVTSLGASVFIDFFPWFENDVSFRVSYSYSQKVEYFLPENRTGRYYPFIKFLSLRGFIRQDFSYPFYLEEGAGLIYLNDRTFGDVNVWEIGTSFAAMIGYDFRKVNTNGFSIGLGIDYGITFTKTTASYSIFFLQSQYYF